MAAATCPAPHAAGVLAALAAGPVSAWQLAYDLTRQGTRGPDGNYVAVTLVQRAVQAVLQGLREEGLAGYDRQACGWVLAPREDWPTHQPAAPDAPIPGDHWYSGCSPDYPRVNPATGCCEDCGMAACPVCGRGACPDHPTTGACIIEQTLLV